MSKLELLKTLNQVCNNGTKEELRLILIFAERYIRIHHNAVKRGQCDGQAN